MNIPQGFIELFIVGVISFVFKVVFGLITKNENKSDEADRRIETEIKHLRAEMHNLDQRHRENENSLFEKASDIRAENAYMRGFKDGGQD